MAEPGIAEPQLGSTYRLADSLPASVLERMDAELRSQPPQRQDGERRKNAPREPFAGHIAGGGYL